VAGDVKLSRFVDSLRAAATRVRDTIYAGRLRPS
jgi:hypothetical protein